MAVPNIFANATASIPLSQLDTNFATTITLGNTAIQLGNTVTTLNNMTLANVTISSGTSNLAATAITNGTSNVTIASSGGNISMATNGATAITVDTSQNVGIGTASPSTRLDVRQSSASDLQLSLYNNNAGVYATSVKLNADNATGSYYNAIQSYNATTGQWQIGGAGSSSTIVFGTGSSFTERARVNAYGIGLGGATPSSGTGITFPATQSASSDANTLDDYEEGSWSPSVGGNATYNAQEGQYIKIGQLVFIYFDIGINVLGTGSTTTISGVPFTAANIPNQSSAWTLNPHYFANIANGITWLSAYVPENATTISFIGNSTSATTVQMNGGAVFANGARIVGSGTYRASA